MAAHEYREYSAWQAKDTSVRLSKYTTDGILAGATVSLQDNAPQLWIQGIIHQSSDDRPSHSTALQAQRNLELRQQQIQASLENGTDDFLPVLRINTDGEPDLCEWATGFIEALGDELALWTYSLADSQEKLTFALLSAHVAGPVGDAARAYIEKLPNRPGLEQILQASWERIPSLLRFLFQKRAELALQMQL